MTMRPNREQVIVEAEAARRHAHFTGPRFEEPYEAVQNIAFSLMSIARQGSQTHERIAA